MAGSVALAFVQALADAAGAPDVAPVEVAAPVAVAVPDAAPGAYPTRILRIGAHTTRTHVALANPDTLASAVFVRSGPGRVETLCNRTGRSAYQVGYRVAGLPASTCPECERKRPDVAPGAVLVDAAPIGGVRPAERTKRAASAPVAAAPSAPDAAGRVALVLAQCATLLTQAAGELRALSTPDAAPAPDAVPVAVPVAPASRYADESARKAASGALWRTLLAQADAAGIEPGERSAWASARPEWKGRDCARTFGKRAAS